MLAGYETVREAFSLLVADLTATLGWDREAAEGLTLEEAGKLIEFLGEAEEQTVRRISGDEYTVHVIENVQQRLHDEFIDTAWPACPVAQTHPLWIHGEERPRVWRCLADGVTVPLGSLSSSATA